GAIGGLAVGILATPHMIQYLGTKGNPDVSLSGWIHGTPHQFLVQAFTLLVIIVWNVVATFIILKVIGRITSLRMSKAELEGADEVVHGEYVVDLDGIPAGAVGTALPALPSLAITAGGAPLA